MKKVFDESFFFTLSNGEEHANESKILAFLLNESVVFCNTRKFLELDGSVEDFTIVIFMNCNELFYYGADAENIKCSDLGELYRAYFKPYGLDRWCCIKRNMQPREDVVECMKKDGVWDEVMENLPKNEMV